jgi:hypothetical protein
MWIPAVPSDHPNRAATCAKLIAKVSAKALKNREGGCEVLLPELAAAVWAAV